MVMIEIILDKTKFLLQQDMITWCYRTVGLGGIISDNFVPVAKKAILLPDDWEKKGYVWALSTNSGQSHFYFTNDKDALLFTLKWLN